MNLAKKIKDKYKNLSQITKVSLWYTFSNFVQKIIVVIGVPILTRILTVAEYGTYSVYNSWFEIIYNICTLSLASGGYFVGMKKHEKEKDKYDSAISSLCISITILLFALFLVLPGVWKLILALPLNYQIPMLIGIISGCPRDFWATSERYNQKYKKLVIVTLLTSVGVLILQSISALIFNGENRVLIVILGGLIPSVIVGIPILILTFKKGKTFFSKEIWKETIAFNVVLIPYYMSITFLNQIDRVMIDRFIDASHAAYYSVAYRAASTINIFTVALNQSLMPWIFQKLKENKKEDLKKTVSSILILPFLISLFLILMAPEVIWILSGKEYLKASGIIPSVAIGMCLRFVSQIFIDFEMYYEKNNIITISTICIAGLNFILNWIFIPIYGFLSAGYTTLVCFALQAIIHSVIVRKYCKERDVFNFKVIWTIIGIIITISLLLSLIYDNLIIRYCLMLIALICAFLNRRKIIYLLREMKRK